MLTTTIYRIQEVGPGGLVDVEKNPRTGNQPNKVSTGLANMDADRFTHGRERAVRKAERCQKHTVRCGSASGTNP